MWVFEEIVDGKKLTEIINEQHENTKYLPGFKIPANVVCMYKHILELSQYIVGQYIAVLCELELDHWNVNVDELLFLYENLKQLTFFFVPHSSCRLHVLMLKRR